MANLEEHGKKFAKNLSLIRHKKKITRKQLADALQMTEIAFGAYERGRIPTIDKVFVICETLECSITDLLGDTEIGKWQKEFRQRFERSKQILAISSCHFEETNGGKIIVSVGHGALNYIDKDGNVISMGKRGTLKIIFADKESFVEAVESSEKNVLTKEYAFQNALINHYESLPRFENSDVGFKEKNNNDVGTSNDD